MISKFTTSTAGATEVLDVGYEAFRSWIKKGLYAPADELAAMTSPLAPQKVRTPGWNTFDFGALCLFGVVKRLLDLGLSIDTVKGLFDHGAGHAARRAALSDQAHDDLHSDGSVAARKPAPERFILVGAVAEARWSSLWTADDVAGLAEKLTGSDPVIVVNLSAIRREIAARIAERAE